MSIKNNKYVKKTKGFLFDGTLIICLIIFFFMAIGAIVYFIQN